MKGWARRELRKKGGLFPHRFLFPNSQPEKANRPAPQAGRSAFAIFLADHEEESWTARDGRQPFPTERSFSTFVILAAGAASPVFSGIFQQRAAALPVLRYPVPEACARLFCRCHSLTVSNCLSSLSFLSLSNISCSATAEGKSFLRRPLTGGPERAIMPSTTEKRLQGGAKFPTGGRAREPKG